MKIALLSDIHGNLPALEVVLAHIDAWRPDVVIVNGDVVNRGPRPRACWEHIAERVREQGWLVTFGNHEEYTAAWLGPPRRLAPVEEELFRVSRWTCEQLGPAAVRSLTDWPADVVLTAPDGSRLAATHASRLSNTDGLLPWMSDEVVRERIAPESAVFAVAHTHHFFTRTVDETLVVNSGSVGCPFDGDTRTGYAQVAWRPSGWRAELVRLPYDREQTRRDFETSGFMQEAGAAGRLMFREWEEARSHIPHWSRQYRARVLAGDLDVHASVQAYLGQATGNRGQVTGDR